MDVGYNEVLPGLKEVDDTFVLDEPVEFQGTLVNASEVLKLDGVLKVKYTSKCGRCLKDIGGQLKIKIREDFIEGEVNSNPEVYTYNDNYVLIDDILKDNIILNLPVKQVCSENCKGLCPRCGVDLNEKECSCKDEVINPQMEKLKNFFNN